MKRIFRTGFALLMLAAILVLAPAAFAQDTTYGLSDSDFALWSNANATSAAFSSLTLDFTTDVSVVGLDEGGDITVNLVGSSAIDTAGAFSLVVTGDINSGGQAMPVNFEARLVGDMVYFNLGDGNGWMGGQAEDMMSGLGSSFAAGAGLPVDPAALAEGDLSGLMGNEDVMNAMMGLSAIDPSSFIAMTRSDADSLAQFNINFSISDLLQDKAILGMLGGQLGGGAEMTDEELQQTGAMLGMMFGQAVLSFDQYVDTSSNLVERSVLTINLPLEMLGGGAGAGVNVVFDIDLTSYNQPVTVEAPAEFTEMPSGS
ncbi:MAG: hypothetical protein IPK19_19655 [Chloroflexi bacterium]|nr:hypothetical protein [Chloroflexota bacterium]